MVDDNGDDWVALRRDAGQSDDGGVALAAVLFQARQSFPGILGCGPKPRVPAARERAQNDAPSKSVSSWTSCVSQTGFSQSGIIVESTFLVGYRHDAHGVPDEIRGEPAAAFVFV